MRRVVSNTSTRLPRTLVCSPLPLYLYTPYSENRWQCLYPSHRTLLHWIANYNINKTTASSSIWAKACRDYFFEILVAKLQRETIINNPFFCTWTGSHATYEFLCPQDRMWRATYWSWSVPWLRLLLIRLGSFYYYFLCLILVMIHADVIDHEWGRSMLFHPIITVSFATETLLSICSQY